jgi:hypothetical protein
LRTKRNGRAISVSARVHRCILSPPAGRESTQNPAESAAITSTDGVLQHRDIIVFPSSGIHDEGDCLHFSTQIQMLTQAEKLKHTKADGSRASTPAAAKRPRGSNGLHPVTH